jgi:hypothetical protein
VKYRLITLAFFLVPLAVSMAPSASAVGECGTETFSVSASSGVENHDTFSRSEYQGCEAVITEIRMDGDTDSGGEWMRAYWDRSQIHYDSSNVPCGETTVWTGEDNRGNFDGSFEVGVNSDSSNDCGNQRVEIDVRFDDAQGMTKCGEDTFSISASSGSRSSTNVDTSAYSGCEAHIKEIIMDGDTDSGGEWMRAYWEGSSVHYDSSNVHCGEYTVWTGDDNRGEVGDSVQIGIDSDYYNDCGSQQVKYKVEFWRTNRPPNEPTNPDPDSETIGDQSPRLQVDVSDPDGDQIDVSFYDEDSSSTGSIGEAGLLTDMNNDYWYSDSFSYSFSERPIVFITTQTTNGGQNPSGAHLKNVDSSGFDSQHCEFEGGNSCDTHNREDHGWMALEPSALDSVDGIEYGTFQTSSGSGSYSISFSEMSETPLLFTQSQTSDGASTRNTQAHSISSSGARVEFCEQESNDGCEGHTSERVAWLAVDRSKISERDGLEYGTVRVDDSNWNNVNFDQSFSNPVVIADVQTENGGQEALYPEVDRVGTGGAQIRYCESEGNDNCDTHARETVAWLALDRGTIDVQSDAGLIGTDSNVDSGGTASVEWNDVQCGSNNDWRAVADDGQAMTESDSFSFYLNCNDPPSIDSLSSSQGNEHDFDITADVSDPDGNLDRCEFKVSSGGNSRTFTDSNPGNTCSASVSYTDIGSGHTADTSIQATVYDTAGATDSASASEGFPNHAPRVTDLNFVDYISRHGFNVSATIEDSDNGDSELDECRWIMESPDETVQESLTPVHDTGDAYSCEITNITSQISGFEVGDEVDVTLEAEDLHGATATDSNSRSLKNIGPTYSNPRPPNTSVISTEIPYLSVLVNDPEDSPLTVYFMDSDDQVIDSDEVRAGKRANVSWPGLRVGRTHDWYVKVSDGYSNASNTADPWNFTKTVSGRQRLITEIDERYSAIITSVDKISYITYTVQNPISTEKTVEINLTGVNSEFQDGSTTKQVKLEAYESEEFQVQVRPQDNGTRFLEVKALDRGLGLTNTERMEVQAKELQTSTGRAEQVPGIGLIHLIVLAVLAAVVQVGIKP